jgi:S1-C subfamily serine protease
MSDSFASRVLPPALLALGAGLSLWVVPTLLRTAQTERTQRSVDAAQQRLDASNVLVAFNEAMRDIGRAVEPSVVHVSVAGEVKGRAGSRAFTQSGSGWIWDAQGRIVTNAHVVDGAAAIEVQLNDGVLRPATLVGLDLRTDIALLSIDGEGLHPARRSNDLPAQGDMVFAFGSPFEFRFSMSSGIVSGIGRSAGLAEVEYENFIQVDAAINPGNSGGPLTDVRGQVIGMNTAIATGRGSTLGSGQFAGIGLAIPMTIVENVVEQLIAHGSVAKGFLGVTVIDTDMAVSARDPAVRLAGANFQGSGAVVTTVTPNSPAARAGLRPGDVITAIGPRRIASRDEVLSEVGTSRPGSSLALELWRPDAQKREGERLTIKAELGTLDPFVNGGIWADLLQRAGLGELRDSARPARRGVEIGRSSGELAKQAPAGSVIVALEGQRVYSVDDLFLRLTRYATSRTRLTGEPSLAITVQRPDGTEAEVEIPLR